MTLPKGHATLRNFARELRPTQMTTAWLLKNLIGTAFLPPTNALLLLALAGICRKRRWAFGLAMFAGLSMLAQSLPPVANALMATLEAQAGPVPGEPGKAQAIVVLGSGLSINAIEYGGDTANDRSLIRLRYGAVLARRWHLPVLVTGGTPLNADRSEADTMSDILEQEFGVPVRWRETQSMDTADNAVMSAKLLKAAGIRRIVLVTQAFHMPRARRLFEAAGLEVVPAPTDFKGRKTWPLSPFDWLPQARALHNSYYALHECLGIAWFELGQVLRSK